MKEYYVYKHTNKTNGKVYIGITKQNPKERWDGGWGYQRQPIFWNAIKKYSWDGFTHEILFSGLTEEEAKSKEIELIAQYKSNKLRYDNPSFGYNATDGGEGTSGYVWNDELRERMNCKKVCQYSLDGEYLKTYASVGAAEDETNITTANIYHCCIGKSMRAGNYMWCFLEEDEPPEQITDYWTQTGFKNPNIKPKEKEKRILLQYDLEGNFIKEWGSLLEAEKELGIHNSSICQVCSGKTLTAGGFVWRYSNGDIPEKIEIKTLNRHIRKVNQYDMSGNFIQTWESASAAARALKLNNSHIGAACKGYRNQCGNYLWRYSDN